MKYNGISITLAQVDLTVGDLPGNLDVIREQHARAEKAGAALVVFPELAVIGYPPEDLIFTPKLQDDAMRAVEELATLTTGGPAILVGGIWYEARTEAPATPLRALPPGENRHLYNAAFLLADGKVQARILKHHLPNEGVFDEKRVFTSGPLPDVVHWNGLRLGIVVCSDFWHADVTDHLAAQGMDVLIATNASPFESGKQERREALAATIARQAGAPLLYLNQVGGQDELVFDGGSFAMDAAGEMVARLPFFEPQSAEVRVRGSDSGTWSVSSDQNSTHQSLPTDHSLLYSAMMTGLHAYVEKNGFPGVVLGLSGGIDSALTACICVDALGAERVRCVMLPSPYTSEASLEDAAELAEKLGVRYDTLPITAGMEATEAMLVSQLPLEGGAGETRLTEPKSSRGGANAIKTPPPDRGTSDDVPLFDSPLKGEFLTGLARENIQSRLRGLLLMAMSNSTAALLITTGNKSEMAVGYATLYGDMCGAYSVLKDVYKTDVFALARWRNTTLPQKSKGPDGVVIPERTLTRPPSAELRENQADEDSLPPYNVLDPILKGLAEERLSVAELAAQGFDTATVKKVARMLYASEYKRRQSPPGVKLTPMAFGRDRRFPLTNRFTL